MASISQSINPHKHLKEQFVSNLTGSSMVEIAALLTIAPIVVFLRHSFISNKVTDTSTKKNDEEIIPSKSLRAHMVIISVDFVFIIFPMLLFFTVLADWTYVGTILLTFLVIFSVATKRFVFSSAYLEGQSHSFRKSISSYRVVLMIITCLCILAVDFRIFPRKYAKTETYGTSLMDLGVGSFVLANSIVSREARCISSKSWMTALRGASPLILIGFGRLVSTAGVDYQVHVGEYGVHWNFFFTLAAVSILTSIVNVPPQYAGVLGSVILIGYQIWLSHGLNAYLLSDERGDDILSKNKEGFFSIFGYWGMYLIGVCLGFCLFFGKQPSVTLRSNKGVILRIWLLSLLFWLLTLLLENYIERVSRRMCNLAYVTWVLAQNLQVLAVFMISDYIHGSKTSLLEEVLDKNLMAVFLLANVLTGLVNISVETLFASSISALLILVGYAFTLAAIMGIVNYYGVRLKFW